jgi:DNA-binding LacI/PurR family transcriptional regulator/DNA-binding transcriptional regulator YhcF (GntR family)
LKQKATRPKVARNGKQMPQEPADSNRYLYEQIYSELKEEILSGKYRKGDWFPPERVLKDRFKTTHLTVRNALAKLVLEGYIERYSGKGTIVIYARDRASAPRKLLSFPWAQVICDELDEGNALLLGLLETRLRKIPLPVRLSCHHGDVMLARSIYQEAQESRALVILQPAGLEPAEQQGAPLPNTIIIRAAQGNASCPQVIVDDAEGARRAVRHLRDLGYDRIALLSSAAVSASMRQGFMEEIAAPGVRRVSAFEASCAPGLEGGAQAAREMAARDPGCRAFLCASDETAAGSINGLRAAGLTPGVDSAVVGWGNTLLARAMRITSIDPGFDRLSERVLASIMDGMSRGAFSADVFRINPELHVR